MATEETDHENGENTGDKTEHETTKRPRRRFPGESPDTAPTAQVEAAEPVDIWAEKDRKGYFTGRPGPGRGHYLSGTLTGDTGASGVGELSNAEMRALIDSAIRRRDARFWDELVITHPVSAAQMRQGLIKADGGAADAEPVRLELGDLAQFAPSGMTPPVPDDLSGLDADALRQEITRLRDENADLERKASGLAPLKPQADDKPLMAVPSREAVECPDCKHFMNQPGRMIEPLSKCKFCGQLYDDAVAEPMVWTRNRPLPDVDERPGSGVAFSIPMAGSERGFQPVATSHGLSQGIRDSLDRGKKGLFCIGNYRKVLEFSRDYGFWSV